MRKRKQEQLRLESEAAAAREREAGLAARDQELSGELARIEGAAAALIESYKANEAQIGELERALARVRESNEQIAHQVAQAGSLIHQIRAERQSIADRLGHSPTSEILAAPAASDHRSARIGRAAIQSPVSAPSPNHAPEIEVSRPTRPKMPAIEIPGAHAVRDTTVFVDVDGDNRPVGIKPKSVIGGRRRRNER